MANAPEAYVEHRVGSLRVEPSQALVRAHHALLSPLRFLFSGSACKRDRSNMPRLVPRGFHVVVDVLFSIEFREVVHDEAVAFALCLKHWLHEIGQNLRWCCVEGDMVWKITNDVGIGTSDGVCVDGVHGADGEEGEAVEGEPWDAKLGGHVMHPREQGVGDDAIGWVMLQEALDGSAEQRGGFVDPGGVSDVVDGGEVLDAVGEAHLAGGEVDGVEVEMVVALVAVVEGDGFVEGLGVGGGGDDGHVVAT